MLLGKVSNPPPLLLFHSFIIWLIVQNTPGIPVYCVQVFYCNITKCGGWWSQRKTWNLNSDEAIMLEQTILKELKILHCSRATYCICPAFLGFSCYSYIVIALSLTGLLEGVNLTSQSASIMSKSFISDHFIIYLNWFWCFAWVQSITHRLCFDSFAVFRWRELLRNMLWSSLKSLTTVTSMTTCLFLRWLQVLMSQSMRWDSAGRSAARAGLCVSHSVRHCSSSRVFYRTDRRVRRLWQHNGVLPSERVWIRGRIRWALWTGRERTGALA